MKVILRYLDESTELKREIEITRALKPEATNSDRVTVHQALKRLEKQGLVTTYRDPRLYKKSGQSKPYYEITNKGNKLITEKPNKVKS
jgi:DNA-binding PadR family transcriptional regulator